MNWYYLDGEKKTGPFSEATMLELRSCGILSDETQIQREGADDWSCYRDLFLAVSNPHIPVVFKFACPHCQQNISAEKDYSGKNVQCPTCGVDFVVPSLADGTEIKVIPSLALAAESSSCPENSVEAEQPNLGQEVRPSIPPPLPMEQESKPSVATPSEGTTPSRSDSSSLLEALKNIASSLLVLGKMLFALAKSVATSDKAKRNTKLVADKSMALCKKATDMASSAANSNAVRSAVDKINKSAVDIRQKAESLAMPEGPPSIAPQSPTSVTAHSVYTASSSTDLAPAFSISRLIPLFVCCLGLGWIAGGFLMPNTFFISTNIIGQIIPVTMLGVPALILAIIGICYFVRPLRFPTKRAVYVLFFTMVVGLIGLLIFQEIAAYCTESKFRLQGKAMIFVLIAQFIGNAYECVSNPDSNVFEKIFGHVFGVGLCEEATKLIPLFWFVLSGKDRSSKIGYRELLIVAFFSGLGFGIGEAIYGYAPWSGNFSVGSNVLRWFACVPSHAIYTVIDAAFLWLIAPKIISADNNYSKFGFMVLCVIAVAVVHGFYNVLSGITFVGILFDAGSIFLMYFVVVLVAKKTGEFVTIQQQENGVSTGIAGWFKNSKVGQMRLWHIYAACSIMILGSLVFSESHSPNQFAEDNSDNESVQTPIKEYQVNNLDRIKIKEFGEFYKIAIGVGKAQGRNSLEVLLASVEGVDWSDSTIHLKQAVAEVKSIQSGEDPDSRNRKMKKFIEIFDKY
jgi:RsiW-degrading membrane proteinase PrsW (M82 family)